MRRALLLAADQGYMTAQVSLGDMYYFGSGVDIDFDLAIENGILEARDDLAALEENMTGAEISLAPSKAQTCRASAFQNCV